jgi:hypothetical protein
MSRKTSFFLDEKSEAFLKARDRGPKTFTSARTRPHGQRSVFVRDVFRRYDEICAEELPDLTQEEWQLIVEGSKEWSPPPEATSMVLVTSMLDAARRQDGGEKLFRKLLNLSPAARIAIVDSVEQYWAAAAHGKKPPLPGTPSDRAGSAAKKAVHS